MDTKHWIYEGQETYQFWNDQNKYFEELFKFEGEESRDLYMLGFGSSNEWEYDILLDAEDLNNNLIKPETNSKSIFKSEILNTQIIEDKIEHEDSFYSITKSKEALILVSKIDQEYSEIKEELDENNQPLRLEEKWHQQNQEDFDSFLREKMQKLKNMQEQIDSGNTFKKGPGRTRKNIYHKTSTIRSIIIGF